MANDMAKRLMARVKALRRAQELTQEQFAERAGLQYKHYQAIEAGRKLNLQLETLEKLAKGCGLQLWELLNFDLPVFTVGEEPHSTYDATPKSPQPKRARPSSQARPKRANP